MTILGLDISTSTIGWCLLRDNGSLIDAGYLELHKEKDIYEKLEVFNKFLDDKIVHLNNDLTIWVEEALLMFKTKSSMASIIALLQSFNGMCRALIYHKTKIKASLVNVSTARKLCNIKVPKKTNAKEYVLSHVHLLGIIPEDKWEKKRTGSFKKQMGDMSDAYVVAAAGSVLSDREKAQVS